MLTVSVASAGWVEKYFGWQVTFGLANHAPNDIYRYGGFYDPEKRSLISTMGVNYGPTRWGQLRTDYNNNNGWWLATLAMNHRGPIMFGTNQAGPPEGLYPNGWTWISAELAAQFRREDDEPGGAIFPWMGGDGRFDEALIRWNPFNPGFGPGLYWIAVAWWDDQGYPGSAGEINLTAKMTAANEHWWANPLSQTWMYKWCFPREDIFDLFVLCGSAS